MFSPKEFKLEVLSSYFETKEVEILKKHGNLFKALMLGKRFPKTKEENHFINMCKMRCKANTEEELAWQHYLIATRFQYVITKGDFDQKQIILLKQHYKRLYFLMYGIIDPCSDEDHNFINMCKGKCSPNTEIESTWKYYMMEGDFQIMLIRDKELADGKGLYKNVRINMERLAKNGHKGAIEWVTKEGGWEDLPSTGKAASKAYEQGETYYVAHVYNSVGDEKRYRDANPFT